MGKPCDRGVHVVPMGFANGSLIEGDDGLTLIDVGFPESVITIAWNAQVFWAIRALAVHRTGSSTRFSLAATLIISAAPLRSCGKLV
jgi:hypothetical protein